MEIDPDTFYFFGKAISVKKVFRSGEKMMQLETITVGIGEYRIAHDAAVLKTILGSCVGVLIYDQEKKIGGLAHVFLPVSGDFHDSKNDGLFKNKCADILIPLMIEAMITGGGRLQKFIAYIAGGARLFNFIGNPFNIGEKNLLSVKNILKELGIPYTELYSGGSSGRRLLFNCMTGDIRVTQLSKINDEDKQLWV
jgi:chemotaxis protein CheD